jgi:hypothetical protein
MSIHQAFRRQPVPGQFAPQLKTTTIPAPTRGLTMHENEAFMSQGTAVVQTNWLTTLRGVKLRGGIERWCDLHALDATVPPVPSTLRKPVISAFEYVGDTERMYAAQEDKLFDVTASVPVLVKDGQGSGNYAAAQMANADGDYLTDDHRASRLRRRRGPWPHLRLEISQPPVLRGRRHDERLVSRHRQHWRRAAENSPVGRGRARRKLALRV